MRYLKRLKKHLLRFPGIRSIHDGMVRAQTRALLRDAEIIPRMLRQVDEEWIKRIADVLECPDNAHIPRDRQAGVIEGNLITMHNSISLYALSYYGAGNLRMLVENKGVHEPQEERAFAEILQHLPQDATTLELGAYWVFIRFGLRPCCRVRAATSWSRRSIILKLGR